jgi:hypothetical protein
MLILSIGISNNLFSQQSNLTCNDITPWVNSTFAVTETNTTNGLSSWANTANVINSNLTDFASATIVVSGTVTLKVSDAVNDYSAGNFAGFLIESGLLNAGVFDGISISTYLGGILQETYDAIDLVTLDLSLFEDPFIVGFVTATSFDEVEIVITNPLGVDISLDVYYVTLEQFCAGPPLECNIQTALNNTDYPTIIDYANTGSDGVTIGNVGTPQDAVSSSTTDFASLNNLASTVGSTFITIAEQVTDYPAGTFVGFDIENLNILSADLLQYITITTYLDGLQQQTESGLNLLLSANALSGGSHIVGLFSETMVDKVKFSINQPVSVTLGTTRVYSAVFETFCAGPELECDSNYFLLTPEYPVFIDASRTGVDGIACALCEVTDEQNVITVDSTDYATITIDVNVSETASIAVTDALYTYPVGTIAGFVIKDLGLLLQADLFQTLTISTYNDGVFQESRTGGQLLDVALIVLFIDTTSGVYNVGFETTLPFDEIQITVGSLAGASNQIRVYGVFVDTHFSEGGDLLCDGDPVAVDDMVSTDEDITLNGSVNVNDTPSSDGGNVWNLLETTVNGTLTMDTLGAYSYIPTPDFNGIDSFSYSICDIDNDCDTAVVTITVNSINDIPVAMGDIGMGDEDIPIMGDVTSNDTIGEGENTWTLFGIDGGAMHGEVSLSLFGSYTYTPDSNYNGLDTFIYELCDDTECDTALVIITVGPVDDLPVASDDIVNGQQDMSLMGNAATNDTPSGDGGNAWALVGPDGGALHGTVVMNPDGSFTYTPDPEFNGPDLFTYEICDVDVDCDQATVSVFIEPPLPIKLLSFTAQRMGNSAQLDWATAYESNVDYFEIQKAGVEKEFITIGHVRAVGNSTVIQSYQFTDPSPFSGINYYRLREVDFDGKSDISPIQSLSFDTRNANIKVWPNPASEGFHIATDDANHQVLEIDLLNLEGVRILHQSMDENVTQTWIDLQHLPPGVFHLKVTGDGWSWSEKIIKVQ